MTISMFDTREMLPALKEVKPAQSFLKDRYFSVIKEHETAKIDIDIYSGKRRMAPFVHPKIGGKTVERRGYTTDSFETPELSPDMVTTAEDMLKRSMGEGVYGSKSPEDRAAEQLGSDLAELDEIITRREEWMAAQALFTGQIVVSGDGYDTETIQYWPTAPADQPYVALGSGDRWNESTSDPLGDLRLERRNGIQKSGVNPQDLILGTDALDALLNNEGFAKKLDNRRIDLGLIDPKMLPNGVTYWGYLKDSGIDLYSYDEWYFDETSGLEVPMVPAKYALLGSANVRTTMAYGCVTLMRGSGDNAAPEFYAEARVPDSWTQRKNPAGRIVQIKSRPLPIIHQVQGFRVLKVLA
jgi:hypothetical protein